MQWFFFTPLSQIAFAAVLASLNYDTNPPKDFNFTKRNVHFAEAAAPGGKEELSGSFKTLLGPVLPDEPGTVRICSSPLTTNLYVNKRMKSVGLTCLLQIYQKHAQLMKIIPEKLWKGLINHLKGAACCCA